VRYPRFLDQAYQENNQAAARTFKFAREAEVDHAALYSEALEYLTVWKERIEEYRVCPVCGKTVVKTNFSVCPVCAAPKEKIETVN
jgi:rubrerythrin